MVRLRIERWRAMARSMGRKSYDVVSPKNAIFFINKTFRRISSPDRARLHPGDPIAHTTIRNGHRALQRAPGAKSSPSLSPSLSIYLSLRVCTSPSLPLRARSLHSSAASRHEAQEIPRQRQQLDGRETHHREVRLPDQARVQGAPHGGQVSHRKRQPISRQHRLHVRGRALEGTREVNKIRRREENGTEREKGKPRQQAT